MKFLVILLSVLFSLSVFAGANPGYTSCVNGDIWEVGDGHFQLDILEDGLAFYMYETSFSLDVTDVKYSNNRFRFTGKEVHMSSEGEHFKSTVNGLVILSQDEKSATVDININSGETRVLKLKCQKNTDESEL